MTGRIALVDYGAGNLRSVANALAHAGTGIDVDVTGDPARIASADRIVLPGVGAFGHCIGALRDIDGMEAALNEAVRDKGTPFLGICVGMQLLATTGREHGDHRGLDWIAGEVVRVTPDDGQLKVPHMGWNRLAPLSDPLVPAGEAYFVHSYRFDVADPADVIATTDHGGEIVAAVKRGNILGVQFHPEKSQRYGLDLLSRFLNWRP